MGALTGEPSVPLHIEDNPHGGTSQNLVYCRECRYRFGGPYGAISAGVCEWKFCPFCGVRIAYRNPYHTQTEGTWEWTFASPPDRWDTIEGHAREPKAVPQKAGP